MPDVSPENPFAVDRLNSSANFRAEWDVPSVNADVSTWIDRQIEEVRKRDATNPEQKIGVMLGAPGYGKTHLFGRLAHQHGNRIHLVFVPGMNQGSRPVAHMHWHIVESLFQAPPSETPALCHRLASLLQPSCSAYLNWRPPSSAARHQSLRQRLDDDPLTVLEMRRAVGDLPPYHKLADSGADAFPHLRNDVVRALVLGLSPATQDARRRLRGEELPEPRLQELRLGRQTPTASEVLAATAALLRRLNVPIVLAVDQVEKILQVIDGPKEITTELMTWLQDIPNVVLLLTCVDTDWPSVQGQVAASFPARVDLIRLKPLSGQQVLELIRRRLEKLQPQNGQGGVWPFDQDAVLKYAEKNQLGPRGFVQECRKTFDAWLDKKAVPPLPLGGPNIPVTLEELFLKEWNQELLTLQQAGVSAENQQEERLFEAVHEAVKIAQQGKFRLDGVQILNIQPGALKATSQAPKPSLALRMGTGKDAFGVVVGVTRTDAGPLFAGYVTALEQALGGEVAGAVLVRPTAELKVGSTTKARKKYEKAISDGHLRPFPLDEEQLTFEQLECLLRLLQRAERQDLQLDGKTVSAADSRQLVIQTRLLENLKLFDFVFKGWPVVQTIKAESTSAVPAKATAAKTEAATSAAASAQAATAPPASAAGAGASARGAAPSPTTGKEGGQAWADDLLVKVADKLRKWGLPVKALGADVGPSFARLKVSPEEATDINKVRNKAENLRLHLSLPAKPLIGFQAGYISIDVQRPDREILPLSRVLATRPAALSGQPAFPVGVDVSGQAYWLNLSEPAYCHLLIAGTTGSGKSEFMKALIASLAHGLSPDQLQFVLIDPKRVTFNFRGESPYFHAPVAHENDEALPLIEWCFQEMEDRYKLLEKRQRQNIGELEDEDARPRVVLVFDEFADLMLDKNGKKQMDPLLKRLGAKARAAGIHLVLGTQRTEASVVTPLLRSNLPGRISLQVITDRDSKLILDTPGASNLLGKGDLFWRKGGDLLRLQSPFVGPEELEKLLRSH